MLFLIVCRTKKGLIIHWLVPLLSNVMILFLIDAHSKTGRLNSRVNFVLDEFANITPISDMSSMITAASRNIRFI